VIQIMFVKTGCLGFGIRIAKAGRRGPSKRKTGTITVMSLESTSGRSKYAVRLDVEEKACARMKLAAARSR
jgi:hypothetical protein